MAMAMGSSVLFITLSLLLSTTLAEIRLTEIKSDNRPIIPLDEFGFTHHGHLQLSVSKISLSNPSPDLDLSQIGFFLCTNSRLHLLQDAEISCPLQSHLIKKVFAFQSLNSSSSSFTTLYNQFDAADQYTIVFANCLHLNISMTVKSAMYNLDAKTNTRHYLSDGKTIFPTLYFQLSLIYFIFAASWIYVLYKNRFSVHGIHFFMLVVLILKPLDLLCQAEDNWYINRTGIAHERDVLFYIFSFFNDFTLFTLIALIGTGWSFSKPYLQDEEKKLLMIVIPLQFVANIAHIVMDEMGPYEPDWILWRHIFLVVDLVCRCAVLLPIMCSIENLREAAAQKDGKAEDAVNLMKSLRFFRQYYIVVICYIYFTRVEAASLSERMTSYKYLWISVVAGELVTLAFYVFTGLRFKPEAHYPCFVMDDEEELKHIET